VTNRAERPDVGRADREVANRQSAQGRVLVRAEWDGYRCLVFTHTAPGGVWAAVWSRRGHDINRAFPDIADAASGMLPTRCVVDGELLVWADGGLDFAALQRRLAAGKNAPSLARTQPANLMAFDLLHAGGRDLRRQPCAPDARHSNRC